MRRNSNIPSQFHAGEPLPVAASSLVNLIFVIYWLLIFEGALRKWVAPQFSEYIFFIRVPIVLIVFFLALYYRQWPKTNRILYATYLLAFLSAMLPVVQFLTGEYDSRYLLLVIHGWMNYFLYIPLVFIIVDQFGREEINRLIRHTLWIAIVAAPLVIMQYNVSSTDVINQGFGIDEEHQFQNLGSGMGLVRPFGFFSSTVGQGMFVNSCMALTLTVWLMPEHARPVRKISLIVGTLAVLVMLVLSQSRGLFFMTALVFLAAGIGAWSSGNRRMLIQVILLLVMLFPSAMVLWQQVFPIALEAFSERVSDAWEFETEFFQFGTFGRAFHGFYSFIYYLEDTPLSGYLLGFGSNAVKQLAWVDLPEAAYYPVDNFEWGEECWERHIIELGPVLGITYILFRISLTWWLGCIALRSVRRTQNSTAILLFGFVGISLLIGQMTGHGTINGYTWMFVGFCAAAAKVPNTRRNGRYTPHWQYSHPELIS